MVTSVRCLNPVFLPSAPTHFFQPQAVIKQLFGEEKRSFFQFLSKMFNNLKKS